MEIIVVRDFNLITFFSTYNVKINEKEFKQRKSGEYRININDADELNISVKAHNYYSGKSRISNFNSSEKILIKTAYNKRMFGMIFLLAVFCFILGLLIGNNVIVWPAIMLLLVYQLYYFHVKRATFFQILVLKG